MRIMGEVDSNELESWRLKVVWRVEDKGWYHGYGVGSWVRTGGG